MLGNGISQEEISRMTGIPIKEIKSDKNSRFYPFSIT